MIKSIMTLVLGCLVSPLAFAGNGSSVPAAVANSRMPMQVKTPPPPMKPAYNGITFGQYVAENANNPALTRRVAGHQTAFVDFSRAAIIAMPEEFQDSQSGDNRMPASVPSATPVGTPVAAPATPGGFAPIAAPPPPDPFNSSSSSSGPAR